MLQQALCESVERFAGDAQRFSRDWQVRWSDPAMKQELAEISEALLAPLAGLEREFSRAEGPSQPQVAGFLGQLLGTPDDPGPVTRLRALTENDQAEMEMSPEALRLLSETDTLFIQLNGFRAQWQDYLSVVTAQERTSAPERAQPVLPPLPPNRKRRGAAGAVASARRAAFEQQTDANEFAALKAAPATISPPPAWQGTGLWRGMAEMGKALLPFLLALLAIIVVAYAVVSRLPKTAGQAAPVPARTAPTLPSVASATSQPPSTAAPTATATAAAPPTPATTPQPTTTTPAGTAQLSVNPPALLVPCAGTGAASLQLANIGTAPLDWQATARGASGGAAGILLDGAPGERGHLNPGDVTEISVTAQAAAAQGTITISAAGLATPINVAYRVNC